MKKVVHKADLWVRKFDYDEEIIVGGSFEGKANILEDKNDDKYFLDDDD